jgi:hypothetical protein
MQPTPNAKDRGRATLVVLGAMILLLTACCGWLFYESLRNSLELAFADEQTEIFSQMESQALRGTPADGRGALEYAINYYPSGTKQRAGSRLDRIVERARSEAITSIVAHLRRTAPVDLGDDPKAWVAPR